MDVLPSSPLAPVAAHPAESVAAQTQEEIDAIVAVVPRACRANALWAVPLLLDTARAGGITYLRRIAYVLATAQHGSHFGARLIEPEPDGAGMADDLVFGRDEPGTPGGIALGNTQHGDGERFRGRGFVFVRGRAAYANWSQRLALPEQRVDDNAVPYLIADPAAMARPAIAAQILVRGMRDGIFTGVALGTCVNDKRTDYHGARRVIGGAKHAREVADIAHTFAAAMEHEAAERHRVRMQRLTSLRSASLTRDLVQEVRDAVDRLAVRGDIMPAPLEVIEWNGEARQGKFVQLDENTFALHMGRGSYVRVDVQRDLNGVVPPEGRNMALKRTGEIRPALRSGEATFWR